MLSAHANSFRQKSKLAISLSWIGGYVNVVLFLTCGTFVSHMTGNATQFGLGIAQGNVRQIAAFGFLIVCFWLGAVASGLLSAYAERRVMRSKYVLPMAVEGALLSILAVAMRYHLNAHVDGLLIDAMACLSAAAMGLQNATITEISGAVIRTTHLTGVLTDLGLEIVRFGNWFGARWRRDDARRRRRLFAVIRRNASAQRLGLLVFVLLSFLFGAVAGALIEVRHAGAALMVPVAFLLLVIVMSWRRAKALAG